MNPTRDSLQERLIELRLARSRSDLLFGMVGAARMSERPIPERHRFLFYRGHLEAFDRNLLGGQLKGKGGNSILDALFAFGIDPGHANLPGDKAEDWPSLSAIESYSDCVRRDLDHGLDRAVEVTSDSHAPAALEHVLHIAIEHRLMHVETLAYMLAQSDTGRSGDRTPVAVAPVHADMQRIPGGIATLGVAHGDSGTFSWDNEFDEHTVDVPAFEISRCMISNGEYLKFIEAGGYARSECWSPADWTWRCRERIEYPLSWRRQDQHWYVCTVAGLVALPLDWPVYVSHAEASAYARWCDADLPTEAQWHRAAYAVPDGQERAYPWGEMPPMEQHGNFDFRQNRPQSVEADPAGDSAFGVRGLLGNGWEWTRSIFVPFSGFRASPHYPGYSSDFFDGAHYVLKGASPLTARRFLRRSFRNWFRPHYPYVFAGFRCVRNCHD